MQRLHLIALILIAQRHLTVHRGEERKNSTCLFADSLLQNPDSTLEDALDSLFFGDETPQDTVPRITARDTMKVPEELRETDPFRYKWYVAIKDSLTHRIVVDSLIEAGDSLEWPLIDSLYLKDSTDAAAAAWVAEARQTSPPTPSCRR